MDDLTDDLLDERPELGTPGALAEPAARAVATFRARVVDRRLRHQISLGTEVDSLCDGFVPRFRPVGGGHDRAVLLAVATSRLVESAAVAAAVVAVAAVVQLVWGRRAPDDATRYHLRRATRWAAVLVLVIALAVVWRVFAGRVGVVVGLFAAGLGLALQQVVGSLFGWVNILSGGIFRVGDRISMGGVEGDVIDLTPLRTKILEMGAPVELGSQSEASPTWVRGRQYTGRIVSIANVATFTGPVFNYSAVFEYIWEELTLPVSYRSDWRVVSSSAEAERAIATMAQRYPVPLAEVEPRVFVRATDNWMELAARFVVPVRTARSVKSDLTKRVRDRFDEAGVEISSSTSEVSIRLPETQKADSAAQSPPS
jgi:small-conductance mechanosensitive channel